MTPDELREAVTFMTPGIKPSSVSTLCKAALLERFFKCVGDWGLAMPDPDNVLSRAFTEFSWNERDIGFRTRELLYGQVSGIDGFGNLRYLGKNAETVSVVLASVRYDMGDSMFGEARLIYHDDKKRLFYSYGPGMSQCDTVLQTERTVAFMGALSDAARSESIRAIMAVASKEWDRLSMENADLLYSDWGRIMDSIDEIRDKNRKDI